MSVDGIEEFNEEIENKGFRTSGVLDAERKTANGQLRKWKMLFVDQPVSNELPYPFFIEWEERKKHVMQSYVKMERFTPDNEKLEITECIFSVDDPLRETAEWAILLSQKVGNADDIVLPNVVLKFVDMMGERID